MPNGKFHSASILIKLFLIKGGGGFIASFLEWDFWVIVRNRFYIAVFSLDSNGSVQLHTIY